MLTNKVEQLEEEVASSEIKQEVCTCMVLVQSCLTMYLTVH